MLDVANWATTITALKDQIWIPTALIKCHFGVVQLGKTKAHSESLETD